MKKKIISIALSFSIMFSIFSSPVSVKADIIQSESKGTTYYVSTLNGNDNNNGLSEDKAFYSLQKINEIELQPGDRVLLEADSVFTNGYLHIKGSGSEEAPIEIDKYGEGENPRIDTNGQGIWYQDYGKRLDNANHKNKEYVSSSILLYDVEYIHIRNLEITNKPLERDAKYNHLQAMNRTGVAAVAQNKGTIDHIYLDGLNVHDVMGNVYDKHMNNGGIYFTVFNPNNEAETGISRYNDIKIENCIVNNVNRWGIAVGYTAYWDKFLTSSISDEIIAKYGSTGVEIRNNYIKDAGGDAITTMYCDRPIIEYNVSDGVAKQINPTDYSETGFGRVAAAIWPWKCKDAVFQYNEAFDTCENQDGQAWDADYGDGTIYQYNYSHNNGGGAVMICGIEAVNSIFRYNISENDLAGVLNIPGNPNAVFYNNVFYMKEGVPFIRPGMTGGTAVVENNIIYNAGAEKSEDWTRENSRVTYSNNIYYNYTNVPTTDTFAITEDPKFINSENGPTEYTQKIPSSKENITHDLNAFSGYKVSDDSPAINKGKFIADNGGFDFFGNKVSGTPDIGVYESRIASLEVYSSIYKVNQDSLSISGVEKDTLVKDFLKKLAFDINTTVQVVDRNENILGENDILPGGSKVKLSYNGRTKEYIVSANTDNSIKDSIYIINENNKILYVPSLENNKTSIKELVNGISVHSTATIKVFSGNNEVKDGNIEDGMTLKVIAENNSENSYLIKVKNNYQWALDYTGKQGNLWFAQKKVNGVYSNLTNYDATYPQWNGNNYAGVGLDLPNKITAPTETTHGLLVDTMGTGREQGHSMAYRVPKSGTIVLSVKDNEPYLRQAGNSGGKVKLIFTHNGNEIKSYELVQSLIKINVAPMEISVEKGDFIRVEAQNIENPSKPSVHITPMIEYQNVNIVDTEAPTKPIEIKANNITENSVELSWTASTDNVGVVGYEIYNGETLLATVTEGTGTKINGLEEGTEYRLMIKAFDSTGNRSEEGIIAFTTKNVEPEVDTEAPTKPTEIKANNITENSVELSWTASTDNTGVAGYEIYNGEILLARVIEGTSTKLTGLEAGTEYSLTIKAFDTAENKSEAELIEFTTRNIQPEVDTEAPTKPTEVNVSNITENSVELSWKASIDNTGVAGYEIYNGDTLLSTIIEGTSTKLIGLEAGKEYSLTIKAFDTAGNKSETEMIIFTTKNIEPEVDTEAPTKPTEVNVNNITENSVELSWTASTDNIVVAGYEIYNGEILLARVIEETSTKLTGLEAGTEYSLMIKAFDATGNRSEAEEVVFTTKSTEPEVDAEAPTKPIEIKANNITENSVELSWTASTDNVGVVGYEIYNGETLLATVTEGTSYKITGLEAGKEYSLMIKAFDATENRSEAEEVVFTTKSTEPEVDTEAPTKPTEIKANNITENSVELSWTASTDNVGVVGYEIYNGETLLATVTEGTSYKIVGLKVGTEYNLMIKAIDAAGNTSEAGTVVFTTNKENNNTNNNGNEGKNKEGLLPQTGGRLPIGISIFSIITISLGILLLKKKI